MTGVERPAAASLASSRRIRQHGAIWIPWWTRDPGQCDVPLALDDHVDRAPGPGTATDSHVVLPDTVGRLLAEAGYRLQAPAKENEGAQRPDRDAQVPLREQPAHGTPDLTAYQAVNDSKKSTPRRRRCSEISLTRVASTDPRASRPEWRCTISPTEAGQGDPLRRVRPGRRRRVRDRRL